MVTRSRWAEAWAERLAGSSHRARLARRGMSSEDYWDGFGPWQELHRYTGYPGRALDRILEHVDARCHVLDIGAGGGALTVPLAAAANHVTAVEPSPGQVARLVEEAEKAGAANISVIQRRWEDVDPLELGRCDVVTAAYCFQMEDIQSALAKMCSVAGSALFLLHFVDHDLQRPLREITGDFEAGPDYLCLYNVLYEMGHRPDLEILCRDYEIPLDFQLRVFGYSHELSPERQARLREHLEAQGKICRRDGSLWVRRRYRDALISIRFGGNGDRREGLW